MPTRVVSLELVAPATIAPGETVQLRANAVRSDRSLKNVSTQAEWTPATSEVLMLGSTGLATGKEHGEIVVRANYGGLSASARIFVLPQGTFRLWGGLQENGFGLANGTVTVIDGIGGGVTAVTNSSGTYLLYGVRGPVKLHAKKNGYLDVTQQLSDRPSHVLHIGDGSQSAPP